MEEKEVLSSRAELIRLAREECNKQLDMPISISKEKSVKYHQIDIQPGLKSKLFIIRVVSAIILFLGVILVDRLSLSYNGLKSETIKSQIASSQTISDWIEWTSDFANEKIIPVFHRLNE